MCIEPKSYHYIMFHWQAGVTIAVGINPIELIDELMSKTHRYFIYMLLSDLDGTLLSLGDYKLYSLLLFFHSFWFNASSSIFVINLFYLNLPSKYLLLRILYLSLSIHTKTCQIETQKIFFEVWVVEFFRKKSQINSFMFSEKLIEAHHYTLHSKTTSHCVFHSLRIVVRYQCNIVLIKNCTNDVSKG